MVDYVTSVLIAASAFFVALSIGLLVRYRQVSQEINQSSDLARDLWQALEQRMKKQDERILDAMGRLDAVQTHLLSPAPTPDLVTEITHPVTPTMPMRRGEKVAENITEEGHAALQKEAKKPQPSRQPLQPLELNKTELTAIELLGSKPMSTVDLKVTLGHSREYRARLLKSLFDRGLMARDDSHKPFIYQLTDKGRLYLNEP